MQLRLKELRKDAGLTQQELATKIGVEWNTYGSWERGTNAVNLEQACRICDALGCTPNDLVGWDLTHDCGIAPIERDLLQAFRAASNDGKHSLMVSARALALDGGYQRRNLRYSQAG